jgi:hypothetical protein
LALRRFELENTKLICSTKDCHSVQFIFWKPLAVFYSLLLMQTFVAQAFSETTVYRNISAFLFHHAESSENIIDIIISIILVK